MTTCKCEKGEHHKGMNTNERIAHLQSCVADIIHRLECVREELSDLKPHD